MMEKQQKPTRKKIKPMKYAGQLLKRITSLLLAAAVFVWTLFLLKCIQKAENPAEVVEIVSTIGTATIGIVNQLGKIAPEE